MAGQGTPPASEPPSSPEQLRPPGNVIFLDTTLRDGMQANDVNTDRAGALYVAESLADAGVDVIEAGFPKSSPDNFLTVQQIAKDVGGPVIAAFARTDPSDIEIAGEAIEPASNKGRINVCAPFSDLHMETRLNMSRNELLDRAVESTIYAREFTDDVEFSFEDATRANPEFLRDSVLAMARAGASTMMLPDTVGVALPREYSARLRYIRDALDEEGFEDIVIAAHCHNDLGQGVMNTIDALRFGGAQQAEVTIGGVGERNGNVPLEVVVGNIAVQPELGLSTGIDPVKLRHLTHRVAPRALGVHVSEKQPFVGKTSYEHGSGMHQHGVLADERTFKGFSSATFGFEDPFAFKINAQSGKAGVSYELSRLNLKVEGEQLLRLTEAVKDRSSQRRGGNLGHNDLEELAFEILGEEMEDEYGFEGFEFRGDNEGVCEVDLAVNGSKETVSSDGGVFDATTKAIDSLTDLDFRFTNWVPDDIPHEESDAEVGIYVTIVHNGYEMTAYAKSKVIERAGARACLKAVNMIHRAEQRAKKEKLTE